MKDGGNGHSRSGEKQTGLMAVATRTGAPQPGQRCYAHCDSKPPSWRCQCEAQDCCQAVDPGGEVRVRWQNNTAAIKDSEGGQLWILDSVVRLSVWLRRAYSASEISSPN